MEEEEKENKSTKGESLMKGTFILTVAGIVVKIIGSLNWIFVSRVLGGEGIGLYQMAFPIYFFALSVSTAGKVQTNVPYSIVDVIQGLIIIFVIAKVILHRKNPSTVSKKK